MSLFARIIVSTLFAGLIFTVTIAAASEGRYQAQWNGKSYLIIDTDHGHIWTFRGDSMLYNGRVDGDEFVPPSKPQIWQQNHGKWTRAR